MPQISICAKVGVQIQGEVDWRRTVTLKKWARGWRKTEKKNQTKQKTYKSRKRKCRNNGAYKQQQMGPT